MTTKHTTRWGATGVALVPIYQDLGYNDTEEDARLSVHDDNWEPDFTSLRNKLGRDLTAAEISIVLDFVDAQPKQLNEVHDE